ncbi:MAG: nitroreductase family protein [Melioribacteraceae bacterium]|nr:nitroreductase family protein [Melioribacteraceae bacterium]
MIRDLILKNRTYRRFYEEHKIELNDLIELIDLARNSGSGANLQPLKYFIVNDEETCEKIFPCFAWAGYLKNWSGPEKGERPSAYIIILGDTEIKKDIDCDHGIAAQSILLGAVEKGLGGCMIGSINREKLKNLLKLDNKYKILLTIALGKPKEEVVIDEIKSGDVKYWRDENGVHHVPKRSLKEIIISHKN